MADVASTLAGWSSTTNSNSPAGTATTGAGVDDNFREIQGVVVRGLSHKGSDIASSTTTDIGAVEGLAHDITGTTTITGFGTVRAGLLKILKFEGALTLTHNATSLILPSGANITTADGDIGIFISEGSGNWRCVDYQKASGKPVVQITSGTKVATTSGTEHDFTSIPSWVKKITINFDGVSLSGTANYLIQLGDSGGVETTGYDSAGTTVTAAAASVTDSTAGFIIPMGIAAAVQIGALVLTLLDSSTNTWIASGCFHRGSTGARSFFVSGSKSLSATLDTVRITTSNGTDTFDAGVVNIIYE